MKKKNKNKKQKQKQNKKKQNTNKYKTKQTKTKQKIIILKQTPFGNDETVNQGNEKRSILTELDRS